MKRPSKTSKVKLLRKHIVCDFDRHGNERWYLRVPGAAKHRFVEVPYDSNGSVRTPFLLEYDAALARIRAGEKTKKADAADTTSLNFLLKQYFASDDFKKSAAVTQRDKRGVLEKYAREHGHRPYKGFARKHLEMSLAKRSATPGAADKLIKYLKTVFMWAIAEGLTTVNPAIGIKKINKSEGHHAWTDEEIEKFRATHAIGTTARIALELALSSGARRDDLVRLGPRNMANERLAFTPGKVTRAETKPQISLPLTPLARAAIAAVSAKGLTFLLNDYGRSYTGNGFGNRMQKWVAAAGIPHCTTHGLRKSAAIRMAYAGATAPELMAVFGWTDMKTALFYIAQAEAARLTDNAFAKLMKAEGL